MILGIYKYYIKNHSRRTRHSVLYIFVFSSLTFPLRETYGKLIFRESFRLVFDFAMTEKLPPMMVPDEPADDDDDDIFSSTIDVSALFVEEKGALFEDDSTSSSIRLCEIYTFPVLIIRISVV